MLLHILFLPKKSTEVVHATLAIGKNCTHKTCIIAIVTVASVPDFSFHLAWFTGSFRTLSTVLYVVCTSLDCGKVESEIR